MERGEGSGEQPAHSAEKETAADCELARELEPVASVGRAVATAVALLTAALSAIARAAQ